MPRKTRSETLINWVLLYNSSEMREPELPHLRELRVELGNALHEVERLQASTRRLYGQYLAEMREMREAYERGLRAESRLRSTLKGAFGSDSTELIRHGIQPHRGMKKRTPAPPTEGPEEPEIPQDGEE
jgi:hypothetical protein